MENYIFWKSSSQNAHPLPGPGHCLISLLCYVPLPLTSAVSAYSEPSPFEKLDCDESSKLRHIWISGDLRWRPQTIIQMIQIQLLWRVEPETNLCQGPIRAFSWLKLPTCAYCLKCKALVGVLNQEKALVGAFSVIWNIKLREDSFAALAAVAWAGQEVNTFHIVITHTIYCDWYTHAGKQFRMLFTPTLFLPLYHILQTLLFEATVPGQPSSPNILAQLRYEGNWNGIIK